MSKHEQLAGIGVLVTRPAGQAGAFCERVSGAGGKVVLFPAMEIKRHDPGRFNLTHVDVLIVTSSNAVTHGKQVITAVARSEPRPVVIAVGHATEKVMRESGFEVDHLPAIAGSEGVLALAVLNDPTVRSVVIVRGRDGRNLLQDTLEKRGVQVTIMEVYQRVLPTSDTTALIAAWQKGAIQLVTVHSSAALLNLNKMLKNGEKKLLRDAQLVVPTTRMIKLCEDLEITRAPVIAKSAEDNDMFTAVLAASRLQPGNQESS